MADGEEVVSEFHEVRHKKQDGVLLLTSLRVAWAPGEILQTFKVDCPYQQIKAQKISSEKSSKIQLQLVLHSGTQVNFHFTAVNALEQRQKVKDHLARTLTKHRSVPINPELEAKNALLKNNPTIYQLYKDLVTTGLITANEFWANQTIIKDNTSDSHHLQEGGVPSAFLADVQAVYDGCNAVRYNLSTDAMQAIFKTYPLVKEKHAEMVPQVLKEEEFWTQFFQSQFFHHENSKRFDFLSKDEKFDMSPAGVEMKLSTAESVLEEEGYSIVPEFKASKATSLSLIQRCNHHSSRVLQALQEDSTSSSSSQFTSALSSPNDPFLQILSSKHMQSTTEQPDSFLPMVHSLTSWYLQQDTDSAMAHSAITYLTPGGLLMSSGCQKGSVLLTENQQQGVFRHQAAIAELLRHFWSCFPAKTQQLEIKAHKMHQCLVEYSEKQLRELEELLDNTDSLGVLQHMNQCIARAYEHFEKWQSKKKNILHS